MTRSRQQTARKPATKFAHLQKKLQKQKVQTNRTQTNKKSVASKRGGKPSS